MPESKTINNNQTAGKTLPEKPFEVNDDENNAEIKKKRNYYIADLSASSDDDIDDIDDLQSNSSAKPHSYLDILKKDSESAKYNRELQQHIRQTSLREQRRKEALSLGRNVIDSMVSEKVSDQNVYSGPQYSQSGSVKIRYRHDGRFVDETEDLKTERLLPSVQDPKLWKVNCPPGKERKSIIELIDLCERRKISNNDLFITSAFTSDVCRGYIYIEAYKKAHVDEAVAMIKSLYRNKILLVPITEMAETLQPSKQIARIKPGSWVKVNRGVHKGDLALVSNVFDDGFKLELKIVPRLDFVKIKRRVQSIKNKNKKPTSKNRLSRHRSRIPPARPFDEIELRQYLEQFIDPEGVEVFFSHSHGSVFFQNQKFTNGFRVLKTSVSSLDIDVTPTEDEIRKFNAGNFSRGDLNNIERNQSKSNRNEGILEANNKNVLTDFNSEGRNNTKTIAREAFQFQDTVRVSSGDLSTLTGKVVSIKGDKIFIIPNHSELNEPLGFAPSELEKFFEEGEHVKVIKGVHKNETGFITNIDEDEMVLSLFSDTSKKIIKIPVMSVVETSEISTGKHQLGGYSLLDFVEIENNLCGVIVHLTQNRLKILTNMGDTQDYELQNIQRKLHNKNVFALDKNSNQITSGDVAKVVEKNSHYFNMLGTIKYIYRNTIYLRNTEISENCSMFVVPAKSLLITGAPKKSRSLKITQFNAFYNPNTLMPGSTRITRDKLEGCYVTIVKGVYKGLRGLIKAAPNLEKLLIELLAENKIVTVNRTDVRVAENGSFETRKSDLKNSTGVTPLVDLQTPAINHEENQFIRKTPSRGAKTDNITPLHGGKTPIHGGKTPLYSSKTPLYGGKTPLYGDHGQKTPLYGAKTPIYNTKRNRSGSNITPSSSTTLYGSNTPMHGSKTPLYSSKTPAYGSQSIQSKTELHDNENEFENEPVYAEEPFARTADRNRNNRGRGRGDYRRGNNRGRRGNNRGGFRGRGNFQGNNRGGFNRERGNFQGNNRGGFNRERGNFQGNNRGGFNRERGNFQGNNRGGFNRERGNYLGTRGNNWRGGRTEGKHFRNNDYNGDHDGGKGYNQQNYGGRPSDMTDKKYNANNYGSNDRNSRPKRGRFYRNQ